MVADVGWDTALRVAVWCLGLCPVYPGTSTVTLGSERAASPEVVAVCEIAVSFSPHINSAIDELATARPDGNFMTVSFAIRSTAPTWLVNRRSPR